MKSKIIIWAVIFLLPAMPKAQSYNSAEQTNSFMPSGSVQYLVREWKDNLVVSCYYDRGKTFFACSDFGGFFSPYNPAGFTSPANYSDAIPSGYFVRDMKIFNDVLFFCGEYNNGSVQNGFVGWFDLNAFMSGSFTFNSFDLSSFGDVSLLDKMVVYANGSAVKVVALGYDLQSVDIIRVVEINDISLPSYTSFSVPSTYNEFYDNVLYNGNKVVFVGTCSIPNQCLCFRVMDDLSSFAASDGNYNFHYFGTMGNEVSNRTASTCLTGDEIAVAYVYPGSGGFLLDRIRVFDFSTPTTPSNTHSQEFVISDGKDDPMEMTYLPNSKVLAILQPLFKSTDYYPKVLFADIYSQYSYSAPVTFFAKSVYYYSLDTYKKDNIVCVGGEKTYLQQYPVSAPNVCPNNLSLEVAISAALLNTSWSNPCTNIPENPIINNAPLNSRSSYWNPFCQQQ